MNRSKFSIYEETEEDKERKTEPKLLKAKIRELARTYANFSNKNSESARNVMLTLNKLRNEYARFPPRQHVRRAVSSISSCPRCHGYGMGQYRHIEGGVCFRCGQLP